MRRFIVIVDDATPADQDTITSYLQQTGQAYWHRFTDLWLIADPTNNLEAKDVRDRLRTVVPKAHMLVYKIENPNAWSAYGKKSDFDWLMTEWTKT